MFDLSGGFKLIPSWAAHYVFAALLWCGFHYLYVTPVIYDRITLRVENDYIEKALAYNKFHFKDDIGEEQIRKYLECIYSRYFYENRTPITLWTASLGLYSEGISSVKSQESVDELIKSGACGEYPIHKEKSI